MDESVGMEYTRLVSERSHAPREINRMSSPGEVRLSRQFSCTWPLLLAATGAWLVAGCGRGAQPAEPQPGGVQAEVTFCRKLDASSSSRLGVGERFTVGEKREVIACVDFREVTPERLEAIHLIWVDPNGREIFRKYAEVVVRREGESYVAEIDWRKAEDLVRRDRVTQVVAEPGFSLVTRLSISPNRGRRPGRYKLHVYRHRELLLAAGFELLPAPDYVRPSDPGAAGLDLDVVFCARLAADGACDGEQEKFQIGRQREIAASVQLQGVELNRTYALGLIWLDPGGKQVFRKDAEVTVRMSGEGYEARVCWSKDPELEGCDIETQRTDQPRLRIASKLGITPEKKRAPGRYLFRILLADEQWAERAVLLEAPAAEPDEGGQSAPPKSVRKTSGKTSGKIRKR